MPFSLLIQFQNPVEESAEAFKNDQYFLDNKTYRGGTYSFSDAEMWQGQLTMEFESDADPYKNAILQGIKNIAGRYGATQITVGQMESGIAGHDAGTGWDSEQKPKKQRYLKHPAQGGGRGVFTQSNLPAANYAAASVLKSAFAAAMKETGASMDISEVDEATQTFAITYHRGNHPNTNSDIEESMRGLNKVKEPKPDDGERKL